MIRILLICISWAVALSATAAVPTPSHVVVVVMENHSYSQIISSSQAPWTNGLAQRGALFTHCYAATHPSQPNYLILFSGSSQGVSDDTVPPTGAPYASTNLGAELIQAGRTFVAYSEDLPSPGFLGTSSGQYVRRHAPWSNWQGSSANALQPSVHQPFTAFPSDYSQLPTVSFVIPNLAHDMHDGSIAQGDQWLATHLDGYVTWAMGNNSLLILTFDEDDGSEGNHIVTIMAGATIAPGTYDSPIGHRDVLRTVEAMYSLGSAGSGGTAIDGAWHVAPSSSGNSSHKCGLGGMVSALLPMLLLAHRRRHECAASASLDSSQSA